MPVDARNTCAPASSLRSRSSCAPVARTATARCAGNVPTTGPLYPNFHDISLNNVRIIGDSKIKLQGFQANTGGFNNPAYPLVMSMTNVLADTPLNIGTTASDANLALTNVNLPIFASTANRIVLTGASTLTPNPTGDQMLDCSKAFVDFPAIGQSNLFGSHWVN